MSRRTHTCLTCPGRTRHDDQICAGCRRAGHTNRDGVVRLTLLLDVPDLAAPRRADLDAGVDLTAMLRDVRLTWRGTDSSGPTIAGRYA